MYVNESKRNQRNGDQNFGISIRTPPSPVRCRFSPPAGWVSRERNSCNFRHPCTVLTASWLRLPRRVVIRLTLLLSRGGGRTSSALVPLSSINFSPLPNPPEVVLCAAVVRSKYLPRGDPQIFWCILTPPPSPGLLLQQAAAFVK